MKILKLGNDYRFQKGQSVERKKNTVDDNHTVTGTEELGATERLAQTDTQETVKKQTVKKKTKKGQKNQE